MKYATPTLAIIILLSACNGGSDNSSANFNVNAGSDLIAQERSVVSLSGNLSDNTDPSKIEWTQVSGTQITLVNANTLTPEFRTPRTSSDESLVLRLSITSTDNITQSDDITITVKNRNTSSQGINENSDLRRLDANTNRRNNSPILDGREVRTYDGSNNNLSNPLWGAAFSHLERLADAAYTDLVSSMAGATRPSARQVSNNIASQAAGESIPNTFGTSDFLWQWGQFIDHDIGITDGVDEPADIIVPSGDIFFDPEGSGTATIHFNRALFDPNTGTDVSNPRQQENEITAWIDGSMIYGSSDARAAALRLSESSPYLATSDGNLLPFNTSSQTNANAFGVDDDQLFLAGDVRANEQLRLAVMHTLWVREHNRIAAILEDDFPGANGEDIFQAARRLVVAKIQKITYEEYLPALIGSDAISNYKAYDNTVNPGMFNEFSVAAYRYGHSLVNENLLRLDADGNAIAAGHLSLKDSFFSAPSLLTETNSLNPILRGMAKQLSQKLDTKVNNNLRNFLFGNPGQGGFDLVSLNIQRGRDHGVPSYNDMRLALGLTQKLSFADITTNTDLQAALAATYDHVDDIDLWVGGLAEDALISQGSQLGELFRDMHIRQFEAFRDGDRFWYQNDLSDAELSRIDNTTLAKVIIDNTSIQDSELQNHVFFVK